MKIKIAYESDFSSRVWNPRTLQFAAEPTVYATVEVFGGETYSTKHLVLSASGIATASPDDVTTLLEIIKMHQLKSSDAEAVIAVGGVSLAISRAVVNMVEKLQDCPKLTLDGRTAYQIALAVVSQSGVLHTTLWESGRTDISAQIYEGMVGMHLEALDADVEARLDVLRDAVRPEATSDLALPGSFPTYNNTWVPASTRSVLCECEDCRKTQA